MTRLEKLVIAIRESPADMETEEMILKYLAERDAAVIGQKIEPEGTESPALQKYFDEVNERIGIQRRRAREFDNEEVAA